MKKHTPLYISCAVIAIPLLFSSCSSVSAEKAEANRKSRQAQQEQGVFDKEDSAQQRKEEELKARIKE